MTPAETSFSVVPVRIALPAADPVPAGYMRVSDTHVVDVGGFVRDVVGTMADNALYGSHDAAMQQVSAAAVAVEIARSASPGLGAFMEVLCFPAGDGNATAAGNAGLQADAFSTALREGGL